MVWGKCLVNGLVNQAVIRGAMVIIGISVVMAEGQNPGSPNEHRYGHPKHLPMSLDAWSWPIPTYSWHICFPALEIHSGNSLLL